MKVWQYNSIIISSDIKFDQVWSSLIHFDPDSIDKNSKIAKLTILIILTILDRSDSIWSKDKLSWKSDDIFQWLSHQKSNVIKFDQVWSILDRSDSIWSKKNWKLKIWWYISMIISSEIENVEKVENLIKVSAKLGKAF